MLTKNEIVEKMAEKLGEPKKSVKEFVDNVFDIISESLSNGEEVKISNFGKFEIKDRSERMGVNPKTLEKIQIPAAKRIKFSISSSLKKEINS